MLFRRFSWLLFWKKKKRNHRGYGVCSVAVYNVIGRLILVSKVPGVLVFCRTRLLSCRLMQSVQEPIKHFFQFSFRFLWNFPSILFLLVICTCSRSTYLQTFLTIFAVLEIFSHWAPLNLRYPNFILLLISVY